MYVRITILLVLSIVVLASINFNCWAQVNYSYSVKIATTSVQDRTLSGSVGKYDIDATKYYVLDSALCDLNKDGFTDKIVVLLSKQPNSVINQAYFGPKFQIFRGNANGTFSIWYSNNALLQPDSNCPADGYQKLVVKGSYFTIESSICAGWLFVHQFITFKCDAKSKTVMLYKYSEAYTDRTDPDKLIPAKYYDKKKFAPLPFNQVTDDFIRRLRQKSVK